MIKRVKNLFKIFICLALVVTLSLSTPFIYFENVFADENADVSSEEISTEETLVEDEETSGESSLVGELEDKREQNVKHFYREDGSIEAVYYPYSVHYEEDGEWIDIDNSLMLEERAGEQIYVNTANSFETSFAVGTGTNKLVEMVNDGTSLSWVIPDMEDVEVEIVNSSENEDMRFNYKLFSKVTYKDALNGVDVSYVLNPDGIKEYFIVESAEELEKLNDITLVLKTDNLEVSSTEEEIKLKNGIGRTKFTFSQPIMFDGNGEHVKEVSFELKEIKPNVSTDVVKPTEDVAVLSVETLEPTEIANTIEDTVAPTETANTIEDTVAPTETANTIEDTVAPTETANTIEDTVAPTETANIIEDTVVPTEEILIESTINPTEEVSSEISSEKIPDGFSEKTTEYIEEISEQVENASLNDEGYYTYTLNISEHIEDIEEITFPLIIDPDITSDTAKTNVSDSFISQNNVSVNYGYNERLKIGVGETSGINRSYVKINTLPTVSAGDMIVNATLVMPRYMDKNTNTYEVGYDAQLNLHQVTSSWAENTITWENVPTHDSTIISADFSEYFDITTGQVSVNTFDITGLVRKWYSGTDANYGVMIKNADESANAEYHEFASGEMLYYPELHPYLSVVYVNAAGLEDSYSYHEQAIGRAGVSYINDATGHLTLVHNDAETTDEQMSASLFHTYNTSLYDTQSGYGKGFRISYDQTITKVVINEKNYYKVIDEDGTSHYFYQDTANSNLYYDERNKNNKLTVSGTTATLVYGESHITKTYTNDKLSTIKDANGNTITIKRNASTRVEHIIDSSNNKITLRYNTNNWLDSIEETCDVSVNESGKLYTYFTYDANGYLTQIEYPDGKLTTYTYSNGYLSKASNFDGYEVAFSYTGTPKRVSKVTEQVNSTSYSYLDFTYGHLVTTVKDRDSKVSHYRFNNFGQLISEQDNEGNAVYYDYEGKTPGKKEQLKSSSDIYSTSINLLGNGGFESSGTSYWSISNTTADAATIERSSEANITAGSLKISKTIGAASSYIYATNTIGVGETYNFSCYIRTDSSVSASIYIEYRDADGNKYITKKPIVSTLFKWVKNSISVEIPDDATGTIYSGIIIHWNSTGDIYMDDAQLSVGNGGNETNLIKNADFRNGVNNWVLSGTSSADTVVSCTDNNAYKPSNLNSSVFNFNGDINTVKSISQTISVSGKNKDTYVVGGFIKANSIPAFTHTDSGESTSVNYGKISLRIEYYNDSSLVETNTKEFAYDTYDWQYLSFATTADNDFNKIKVSVIYTRNLNYAYIDGISLYKDGFSTDYTYSQDDNDLTKVETKDGDVYSYEYDENHNLSESTDKYGHKTLYDYDDNHNLDLITNYDGTKTDYEYDVSGNITSTKKYSSDGALHYYSESLYDASKNLKIEDTDARGNTVEYDYTEAGLLKTVTDAKTELTYSYNSMNQLTSVCDSETSVNYTYNNDNLNSVTVVGGDTKMNYFFTYNSFGQNLITYVGGRPVITNTYNVYTKNLTSSRYYNGYTRNYEYDDRNILVAEKEGNTEIYRNYYGSDGSLSHKRDNLSESTIYYDYDDRDRVTRVLEDRDTGYDSYVLYSYDDKDLVTNTVKQYNNSNKIETYNYNEYNLPIKSFNNIGTSVEYEYDSLNRVSKKSLGANISLEYTYTPGSDSGRTTGLVYDFSVNTGINKLVSYSYLYDETGLIEREMRVPNADSVGYKTMEYQYDSKSQLISARNVNDNRSMVYNYDERGNILSKSYCIDEDNAFATLWTKNYTYDSTWTDLLISYDGKTIEYDNIGNPTKYLDYTSLSWNGRKLEKIEKDSATVAEYKYNSDGLRIEKTVDGATTEYIYLDGKLSFMTSGGHTLYFFYDSSGDIVSVTYNGSNYYYLRNPQGDVIGLFDVEGNFVERYSYDAWGKPESEPTSTIGQLNPFRYRGYIYDEETGFYYVSSRYYDSETGRFINADDIALVTASPMALTDKNLFAYCDNNPIMRVDSTGTIWETVFDVVSLGFSIAEVAMNPYDVGAWIGLVGDAVDLIPFVTGVGEVTRGIRFVDKAGNTLEIAKAVDFTDDAKKTINGLDSINGFTKSTRLDGIEIHKGYKKGPDFLPDYKEYKKVDGIRPDYYDGKTIFELKPFNSNSAKAGIRQLRRYNSCLGGGKIMRLEFY